MCMRGLAVALIALVAACITPTASAQRGRGVPSTHSRSAPAPRAPANSSSRATAQGRQAARAAREFARSRRSGSGKKKGGRRDERDDEEPRPKKKDKEKLPEKPADAFAKAKFSRIFLSHLARSGARIKSESYWSDVTLLSGADGAAHYRIGFTGIRNARGSLKYRVSVYERSDKRDTLVRRILVHESPGRRPVAWIAGDKAVRAAPKNALSMPLVPGRGLRLADVIPFVAARYRMAFEGLGMRDGKPVAVFKGALKSTPDGELRFAFKRDDYLLLRIAGKVGGKVDRVRVDSDLKVRDGIGGFESRRFVLSGGAETAIVRIRGRKINGKVDPFHFDPSTFER